jgi:hypothetical protein
MCNSARRQERVLQSPETGSQNRRYRGLSRRPPDLMKAAVEGRLPRGIGVTRLRDAPAEWSRQYAMLGLSV